MPTTQTLERFIASVEENRYVDAIEEFYAEHASVRENLAPPRVGRAGLVENERKVLANARSVESRCIRPVFVSGDHVVTRWLFRFEWRNGRKSELEELSYQRWEGERIVEEQFFYDPAQLPRPSAEDVARWHRWFAIECNNRAWRLAEQESRSSAEDAELLDAAHASAFHWGKVGTDLHRNRATMLLAHAHALLGNGRAALRHAQESFDYVASHESPDWEVAFAHAVLANAGAAAGDRELHAEHYGRAQTLAQALEREDREIFDATFRRIPAPSMTRGGDPSFTLVQPSREHLASYLDAMRTGWSWDNVGGAATRVRELAQIERDPDEFLRLQTDREGKGPPITLPDGSTVPRLPGYKLWMWDGEFCGAINLRWQPGTAQLPPHVLGHIGYGVVPWKRQRGYASKALALVLEFARAEGLPYVEITTDRENVASQRTIVANGGVLVERFIALPAHGGGEKLRYRIELAAR